MIKPKRRVQLTIDLGADSWDIAADTLQSIVDRIKTEGPITQIVSGGYDSGYWVTATEKPEQTGDKFRLENQEYCDSLRQKAQENINANS